MLLDDLATITFVFDILFLSVALNMFITLTHTTMSVQFLVKLP